MCCNYLNRSWHFWKRFLVWVHIISAWCFNSTFILRYETLLCIYLWPNLVRTLLSVQPNCIDDIYTIIHLTIGNSCKSVIVEKLYLNINSITNFIHFHVCWQWNDSMSAEFSGEQIPGSMPVTFWVCHIDELSKIWKRN